MNPGFFRFLAIGGWVVFWMRLWDTEHSYWFWIALIIGISAVFCTAQLAANLESTRKSEDAPDSRPTAGSPWWVAWVIGLFWASILMEIAARLPPYWSQLFPLIVIIALYIASRLWAYKRPEADPEDLSSRTNAQPGA